MRRPCPPGNTVKRRSLDGRTLHEAPPPRRRPHRAQRRSPAAPTVRTEYHAAIAATAGDVTAGSEVRVTPGGRIANPGASLDPNAGPGLIAGGGPGPGTGGLSVGAATDVTVVEP